MPDVYKPEYANHVPAHSYFLTMCAKYGRPLTSEELIKLEREEQDKNID